MGVPLCWGAPLQRHGKGNTATAIPVLEKKLRESSFSLPEEFKP
jgi:hypothetical protein